MFSTTHAFVHFLLPEIFHSPLIHEPRELNTCALNCRQALDRFGSRGSIRLRASIRFWRYCRGGEGEGSCFVDKEKLVEFSSVEFQFQVSCAAIRRKVEKLLMFNSRPIVIFVKRGNFKLEICTVIKRTLCKNVFELLVG